MIDFNLNKVDGTLTLTVHPGSSLKSIMDELEESLNANRNGDELLRDNNLLDEHDFYYNELAYSRIERIILKFKHDHEP